MKKEYQFEFIPHSEVENVKNIYGVEDNGHSWPHINDVLCTAEEICQRLRHPMNTIIEYACLYHDISLPLKMDRKTHHVDGANKFIEMHPNMNVATRELIAQCIREHRSSVGGCSSLNSEIVASADNGIPSTTLEGVVDRMIMRSVRHHIHTENEGVDKAIQNAINHIINKYGENGYCEYPTLYLKMFESELKTQTSIVNSLRDHEDYIIDYVKSNL